MSWRKKIDEWQQHGVISNDTAQAIIAYEATRPHLGDFIWRYGLLSLAGLCICLGVLFIVAANWQSIPFGVKLSTHAAFNFIIAGMIAYGVWRNDTNVWKREIPLMVLAAAQLSLMALIGQYLQINSSFEDVMRYWFMLAGPMLFLLGRTPFSAALFFSLGVYLILALGGWHDQFYIVVVCALASVGYITSFHPQLVAIRPSWTKLMRNFAIWGAFIAACVMLVFTLELNRHGEMPLEPALFLLVLLAVFAAVHVKRLPSFRIDHEPLHSLLFLWALGVCAVMQLVGRTDSEALSLLLFCAAFMVAGIISYRQHALKYLTAIILVVAGRLIIYFTMLTNNMLINGIWMIVIGSLALYLIRRLLRQHNSEKVIA